MLERLRYHLTRALRNMRQSPFLSGASVLTMAVALGMVSLFAVVVLNLQQAGDRWGREIQVVAYLEPPPPAARLEELRRSIEAHPDVHQVVYVSQQEALQRFSQGLGDDRVLLDGLSPGILPASLEVSLRPGARNAEGAARVAAHLGGSLGLREVSYGREWLERFEAVLLLARVVSLLLGGILVVSALFIVANTIRLTLFARKDELEIMTLVGGTTLFIKAPFLIEGVLQGALGGALALAGVSALHHLVMADRLRHLLLLLGDVPILFLPPALQAGVMAAGVALGLVGSLVSLRKFVRIQGGG